jgi:polyphenol oxidase
MILKEHNGVVWFEFELLQKFPHIRHAAFSRIGGVSSGDFASLNFILGHGDSIHNVTENRKRALNALSDGKNSPSTIIRGIQIHDTTVFVVDDSITGNTTIENCHAFITKNPLTALTVSHADCQAALFFDPKNNVLANVHCGWRGNVTNIYRICINNMINTFGSNPEDIFVCISPSLGPQASEFLNYKTELPETFWPFQIKPTYFNLWDISNHQLLQEGILQEHIEIARMCTYTEEKLFFSYRRKKISGRGATIAWIDPQ